MSSGCPRECAAASFCHAHVTQTVLHTGLKAKTVGTLSGTAWCRKGEAICSIALLCLGGALVIYGVAMMNFGNPTMTESELSLDTLIAE